VSAYYSAGYEQADIPAAAFQDWYSVPLAAGATTIKIANVPANITVRAAIYDEDYVRVDTQSAANVGATLTMPVTIPKAGTYRIAVDVLIPPVTFGTTVILPETLTRPYALTVTQ
jgi:hypothetical protein